MIVNNTPHFLISRVDNIGDVVLTLPVCGFIKSQMPEARITFLGKTYTKDIASQSKFVDNFLDYSELEKKSDNELTSVFASLNIDYFLHIFPNKRLAKIAKAAKIKNRIGTLNRHIHWLTCNHLPRVSRSNSDLHESQLNIQLLKTIFLDKVNIHLNEIPKLYGYEKSQEQNDLIDKLKFNLILHPLSFGSAKDWPLACYKDLINKIDLNKFKVFVSGTLDEQKAMKDELLDPCKDKITDITGAFSLKEFIQFISLCDGMLAASTGPLHIASAFGLKALGLFSFKRPIHPDRWKPVGFNSNVLVEQSENSVKFLDIPVEEVLNKINSWR